MYLTRNLLGLGESQSPKKIALLCWVPLLLFFLSENFVFMILFLVKCFKIFIITYI
jgi:hypothetical protein